MRAERLLLRAARLLPRPRADYLRGLLAEVPVLPPGERRRWLMGGAWFVLREVVASHGPYIAGLAVGSAMLVAADRSPSDVANQASLLVLSVSAGALGFARPRWAWFSGAVVGTTLALAHATYEAVGMRLPYPMSPPGWTGALTLLLLLAPAWGAAHLGAAAGRRLREG